jgi:hypothetical protein
LFIPEPVRKKTEKDMNKLLTKALESKFKMQVITAGGNMSVIEWSVNIVLNNLKIATGIIFITKKTTKP